MKTITLIETFDGQLHRSKKDAEKHIDKLYGDKLLPLAGKLAQIDKYSEMSTFIDENLTLFLELHAVKQDLEWTSLEEEE